MKTNHRNASRARISLELPIAIVVLIPTIAFGDFSGSDSLSVKTAKWEPITPNVGAGKCVFQNSHLEFLVKSPTNEDRSILRWTPNEGGYDQNWFIQVGVHLDTIALGVNSHANLNMGVVNSEDHDQGFILAIDRYTTDGVSPKYVSGIEATSVQADNNQYAKSAAIEATLRLHFDAAAKTMTSSWNAGAGWKYFSPVNITDWGMNNSSTFTAILIGASGGNHQGPDLGPVIAPGAAYFTGFETGTAKPDIAVEQPAGSDLTAGSGTKRFGSVVVNSGSRSKTFTIRNSGTAKLKRLQIAQSGPHSQDFTVTGLTKSALQPGGSTTFEVTFSPQASGTRDAAIQITSNDPDESLFEIPVTGLGVE
jgi:hypothetical protein